MEKELNFSIFLKEIKEKEHLLNSELAGYLNCTESSVSMYLANKSQVGYNKIVSLKDSLKDIDGKDLYDYIFGFFPVGFYHGSRQGINGGIDVLYNKGKDLDFGTGFYLGTSFKQSMTFISFENTGKDRIYHYSFSLDGLKVLELRGISWVFYISYMRKKIPLTKENMPLIEQIKKVAEADYDVVYGPIADDRMAISINNFFNNNISINQLLKCLSQLSIGDQYCLKTNKAVKNLKLIDSYNCVDPHLRKIIRDYSSSSIDEAIKNADAINKINDGNKKFYQLLKEYEKKSLF